MANILIIGGGCGGLIAAQNIAAEIKGEQPDEIYYHEIAAIIDRDDENSIYLHYGIWNDKFYELQKGTL